MTAGAFDHAGGNRVAGRQIVVVLHAVLMRREVAAHDVDFLALLAAQAA